MAATTFIARGTDSLLNISSSTVVKAVAGRTSTINVLVAGSAAGGLHDTTTTGAAASSNQIYVIPNTVGTYVVDFPHRNGIVVVPGTGQTVAICYS